MDKPKTFEEIAAASFASLVTGEHIKDTSGMPVIQAQPTAPKHSRLADLLTPNRTFEDSCARDSDELVRRTNGICDEVLRDELEKEKSKNRELSACLNEKDNQLKIAERQTESMKRHMLLSQNASNQQQEEIQKLRNEINRLTVFKSAVGNYQNNSYPSENNQDISHSQ